MGTMNVFLLGGILPPNSKNLPFNTPSTMLAHPLSLEKIFQAPVIKTLQNPKPNAILDPISTHKGVHNIISWKHYDT